MAAFDDLPLDQWREEAAQIGGLPQEMPTVPPQYIYTANRLIHLIDALRAPVRHVLSVRGVDVSTPESTETH